MDANAGKQTQRSVVEMQQYFATELESARATTSTTSSPPIATAQIPDLDGQLWPIEVAVALSICQQLFVGWIETTTRTLR